MVLLVLDWFHLISFDGVVKGNTTSRSILTW
jgi:hypothetical protein